MKANSFRLERNARVCLSCFPFWAVSYTFYIFYLSLYLKASGISDVQLGNLMLISNVAGLLGALVAAPIVDWLGRRWATFVFDMLSSVLPVLLFICWPIYPIAVVAMILTGLNRIMSVGFYLLMIENGPEQNSIVSMNLFNVIMVVAGLMTPFAGFMVFRLGVMKAEQVLLLAAIISMTAQATVRHLLVKETPAGIMMRQRASSTGALFSGSQWVRLYRDFVLAIRSNPDLLCAMAINALVYVYFSLGTTSSLLFTPFFTDYLGLQPSLVSLIGGAFSGGTLLSMAFINRRLHKHNLFSFARYFALMAMTGSLTLVLSPHKALAVLFCSIVAVGLAYGVLKTVADAALALETKGPERSAVYSIASVLSSLLGIACIKVTTVLYASNPVWLMIICILLLGGVLVASLHISSRNAV